jgi:trigger factor
LKIETQPLEEHQVKLVAEFEPEVLEKYKLRAAQKISKTNRIPGFRPGKAPYAVIRRMVGEETIEHEAIDLMLDDEYQNVIKEAGIDPAGPGNLDEIVSTNPPKFAFTVPLAPKTALGDYHSIRRPYEVPAITEDRVDQVVKNMRASYSTAEPVERPVQEGDLVTLRLTGELTHPAEGENALVFHGSSPQMIVGENDLEVDNWPFDGFTRELVGLSLDGEKELTHSYPAEEEDEKLRGKEVKFTVKIESLKSLNLPEVTDEFAQSLGDYATVAALRQSIRETLEQNEQREYDNKSLTGIVDEIRGISTILYPPQVLQEEVDRVVHSLEDDLAQQKMDLSTYLKTINKEKEEFIETEAKPVARQRLERTLILDEIAHAESIQLDVEALQKEAKRTMAALQNDPEYRKMAKGRKSDDLARGVTIDSANRVLNRQVLERLKAIARGQLELQPEIVAAASPDEPEKPETEPVASSVEPIEAETEPVASSAEPVEAETAPVASSTEAVAAVENPAAEGPAAAEAPAAEGAAGESPDVAAGPKVKKARKKKIETSTE